MFSANPVVDSMVVSMMRQPQPPDTKKQKTMNNYPMAPDEELRKELGIREDEHVLFTAARLIGWKGIQYGVAAMSKSRHRNKLRYLIAGEGSYRSDLEKKITELDLGKQVQFIGMLPNEELPRYYSITDIALYPSIADETFGISIAEAMATDTPVITCNVGGIPEVVGNDSILVPPRNEDRITSEIDLILGGGFKGKPRKRITDNFNWNEITGHFMQLLETPQV